MTETDAILVLMKEARAERASNTACQRAVRALQSLGLPKEDVIHVLAWLDYCNGETGEPWRKDIKRTWR